MVTKRRFAVVAEHGLQLTLPLLAGSLLLFMKLSVVSTSPPIQNGTICTLIGEVTTVTENRAGESIILHVAAVSLPDKPTVRIRTSFLAEALLRKNAPAVPVNSKVTMTGFFTKPPEHSAANVPIRAILLSKGVQVEFEGTVDGQTPAHNWILSMRSALPGRLVRLSGLSSTDCNLLISLLFGGTAVGSSERTVFLRAGLLHLLAASGANVLLVSRCFMAAWKPVCRYLPGSRWLRLGGDVLVTWAFVAMCGGQSSIVRAGCMSTYRTFGQTLGRTIHSFDALLAAAYIMALWQPIVWQQPGTWLSFAATYAVGLAIQPRQQVHRQVQNARSAQLRRRLGRVGMSLLTAVRMTLMIELLTMPFVLHWFGQLSTVSILANIMAEPMMLCLLPMILVLVLLAALPHLSIVATAAAGLADVAAFLLHVLLRGSNWLGHWRYAYLMLPKFTWIDVTAWYAALFLLYLYRRTRIRTSQSVIIERRR